MTRRNGTRCGCTFLAMMAVGCLIAHGQTPVSAPVKLKVAPGATVLDPIVVTGQTPSERQVLDLAVGTTTATMSTQQINQIGQGENSSFNQILTHLPGASGDTYGAVHFRGEDPYYRYSINGTLLPAGITGFGQLIDTWFVDRVTLKIGALPAYYPEGNYGIVDIQTKSGASLKGGSASFYGGSNDTLHPTFSYGGSSGGTDFFFTGSFVHNDLGLENPTPSSSAIHDLTNQLVGFADISHQFKDSGRVSFIVSAQDADYQIPNTPGQVTGLDFSGAAVPPNPVPSANLNETQNEQTYYGILAWQQTIDDFSFQISQVNRYSSVLFRPDINGDLYYNGVASRVNQAVLSNGVQADFTQQLGEAHTLRAGYLFETQGATSNSTTEVFPTDSNENPIGSSESIQDNHHKRAFSFALYLQDQWTVSPQWTINYGLRFEQVNAYIDANQISPRINAVYQMDENTAFHAGYARYFDPPPLLNISPKNVKRFDDTTNAAEQDITDPVRVERSHYFDVGVTHTFLPGLEAGVDAYYKLATDQIDDGQFGAANIGSPYNYGSAAMYGVEFSVNYTKGGFSAFGNFAAADSWAKNIVSSQFEFEADELAYIATNHIQFDQQQYYTASAGLSYTWLDTTIHSDMTYGDGIRAGFANTAKLGAYYPVNFGVEHTFRKLGGQGDLTVRFDVLNAFDQIYVLNDGTGIGEGAVKYGNRRGFFGGLTYRF